jgi:hypothetical protein
MLFNQDKFDLNDDRVHSMLDKRQAFFSLKHKEAYMHLSWSLTMIKDFLVFAYDYLSPFNSEYGSSGQSTA